MRRGAATPQVGHGKVAAASLMRRAKCSKSCPSGHRYSYVGTVGVSGPCGHAAGAAGRRKFRGPVRPAGGRGTPFRDRMATAPARGADQNTIAAIPMLITSAPTFAPLSTAYRYPMDRGVAM